MARNTLPLLAVVGVLISGCTRSDQAQSTTRVDAHKPTTSQSSSAVEAMPSVNDTRTYEKPPEPELAKKLTPTQFEVTQNDGTEYPFKNEYWDNLGVGLYVDVVTGEPLFASYDKFKSGTGWPSFTKPVQQSRVVEKHDVSAGMERVEVRSKSGDSHLGHVFNDGPAPTGQRYCINSASLRFIPFEELKAQGYGVYVPLFEAKMKSKKKSAKK